MSLRTFHKLIELWSNWSLSSHIPPFYIGNPPISQQNSQSKVIKIPKKWNYLLSGLINLHFEGVFTREEFMLLSSVNTDNSLPWLANIPEYALFGLGLSLSEGEKDVFTLNELMMQVYTPYNPTNSDLARRFQRVGGLAKAVYPLLVEGRQGKEREKYEEMRVVVREVASPEMYQALSRLGLGLEEMRNREGVRRDVQGIRDYKEDGTVTIWARRYSSLHVPILTKPDTSLASLMLTRPISLHHTDSDGLKKEGNEGRKRPKTAGAVLRSQSVASIRPKSQSRSQPATAPQSNPLTIIGISQTPGSSPCFNHTEHLIRVLSREATPWVPYRLKSKLHLKLHR